MRNHRTVILVLALMALVVAACGDFGDSTVEGQEVVSPEMLDAIPSPNIFVVTLPATDGAVSGDNSLTFWRLTRSAAGSINSSVATIMDLPDEIRPFPPESSDSDQVTWVLNTPIGDNDVTAPRLTVTRLDTLSYSYSMALSNIELEGPWVQVMSGNMVIDANTPRIGAGQFTIDYTAIAQTDSSEKRRGQIGIELSSGEGDPTEMSFSFRDFYNTDDPKAQARNYSADYRRDDDGAGYFHYQTWLNWIGSEDYETFTIRNRWNSSYAGVAQIQISGQAITDRMLDFVEIRECWSATFGQTYYVQVNHWSADSDQTEPTLDDESGNPDDCVFDFEDASAF